MSTCSVELPDDLASLLQETGPSPAAALTELAVLELYRRGVVSSGKAAEMLRMPRLDFIHHAAQLDISFAQMTEEEWEQEKEAIARL